ncbi:MAG: hypothetical protein RI568_14715 [Natronomonas sp.]|uniref:hypothetical protein n=1 Tax=Natronomonas sp. TaxID=2184060 RepID=UPI00286FB55B|nr:hypothetical protein [Natronomonas sp.]MDR9431934.1 hypothetical protein [Natronomonas sp.]
MNRLGEANKLPVLNIREGDVAILFGLPLAGLVVGSTIGIDALAIGFLLVGFTLGVAIIYATPSDRTATQWVADVSRYVLKRPHVTRNYRAGDVHSSTEGGVIDYTPFEVTESTQELTNVERAWPGAHAIERRDGSMEAFVELTPSNMDFAMSTDWASVQEAAETFANTEIEFPITLYVTTRAFPVETLVSQLESRLYEDDVRENPVFGELIEEYREQRPSELTDVQECHYYLGVEADRMEVHRRYDTERTPAERLSDFPLIGFLFNPFVAHRVELEEAEIRTTLFEKLDERIQTVRSEFVDDMSGWSSRRLTTTELFYLTIDFWNGDADSDADTERLIRTGSAVSRSARGDGE